MKITDALTLAVHCARLHHWAQLVEYMPDNMTIGIWHAGCAPTSLRLNSAMQQGHYVRVLEQPHLSWGMCEQCGGREWNLLKSPTP